jgi:hypothetical protein
MVFLHQPTLKALHYALAYLLVAFEGTLTGAINYGIATFTMPQSQNNKQTVWVQYIRISLLPILFFTIFFIIFKVANPIFNNLTNKALEYILKWVVTFWKHLDMARFFFWLLGILGLGMCLYAWQVSKFWGLQEEKEEEVIMRKRLKKTYNMMYPPNALSLKNEYRMGVLLMAMVNGLLFFVNLIDIQYIWLGDLASFQNTNLATALHEGTYMLILSILLSMSIMLYYFRDNLNFYRDNIWLKRLAYIWVAQNGILVISVALRAYYYVLFKGLAYKRIGVLIFLALTLVGLTTLFFKIRGRKTSYYLLKVNGWAMYAMLMFMTCVDWDSWIVQYNIAHYQNLPAKHKEIDIEFLLNRADKTLRFVQANKKHLPLTDSDEILLYGRIKRFLRQQDTYSFWSWNYEESVTQQALSTMK